MTKQKNSDKNYLRRARNFGIPALIWAVCTANPVLIIAYILSWIADSGGKKAMAAASEILYIVGGVLSTIAVLGVAALGGVISLFSGITAIAGGAGGLIAAALIADVLIGAAAFNLHKGRRKMLAIEENKQQTIESVGFFGSEVYTSEDGEEE